MSFFYSAIILICVLSMITLAIDVGKNTILSHADIRYFRITFILVAFGAICEYVSESMEQLGLYPNVQNLFTLLDYSISPFFVIFLSKSCGMKKTIKPMFILMSVHALFEIVALHFGWVFSVDSESHYYRGPLGWIYITICGISFIYILMIFVLLGKRSKLRNPLTLVFSGFIFLIGQLANLLFEDTPTGYISLCITAILLYIFIQNMLRHIMLETINMEQKISNLDALTKVLSRNSYNKKVTDINRKIFKEKDSTKFAVCECDLNNLKIINDTFGHDQGDEYIINCCKTICTIFKTSPVYRIGGDEFVIILENDALDNYQLLKNTTLELALAEAKKDSSILEKCSFAAGFAVFDKETDISFSNVLKRADIEMYNHKRMLKLNILVE